MLTHEPEALGRDGVVDGFIVVGCGGVGMFGCCCDGDFVIEHRVL